MTKWFECPACGFIETMAAVEKTDGLANCPNCEYMGDDYEVFEGLWP